ncbi:hypothetical protein ACYSNX_02615 [Myroides sp. LJL115]
MKKLTIIAALLGTVYFANAQVGIGTPDPALSAELDIVSETKGVLIPRVVLTSLTDYAPIVGGEQQSLLVYNKTETTTEGKDLLKGFYYWENKQWNRIVSRAELDIAIENIGGDITNITKDIKDIQAVINFILPSNPGNDGTGDDDKESHTTIVYDQNTEKFYYVTYDATSKNYITNEINIEDIVAGFETETNLLRSIVTKEGALPEFTPVAAPDSLNVKVGEIYYQYTNEAGTSEYIDMTSDIISLIENNEEVKNTITNFLSKGGNVYYGDHDNNPTSPDVFYTITETGEKVEIILSDSFILNLIERNIQRIKNMLGDKINNTTIINTGDQIGDEWVYKFLGKTTVGGAVADAPSAVTSGIELPAGSNATGVVSVTLLKGKNIVANNVTQVSVDAENKISFSLGTGNHYTALPAGDYDVIIEFTSSNIPASIIGPSNPAPVQP